MPQKKIMIIEDDLDILELVEYNLNLHNYQTFTATNGELALKKIETTNPDLIILDLMLPGIDGLEVLKKIRSSKHFSAVPVIMLTAKSQESDIIVGLELGADDYMSKPFSQNELIARIKARLRNLQSQVKEPRIQIGPLVIDENNYEITKDGQQMFLTLSEFKLLAAMAKQPGKVFHRDQLLNFLSDQETYLVDRNIDVHVRSIRKKLKEDASLIQTVRGIGYKCQEPSLSTPP